MRQDFGILLNRMLKINIIWQLTINFTPWHFYPVLMSQWTSIQINNETTTVEEALLSIGTITYQKPPPPILLEFLRIDNKFERLFEIVFSPKTVKHDNPEKVLKNAVMFLSSSNGTITKFLLEKPILFSQLEKFSLKEFGLEPVTCGFYHRIVDSLARASKGEILKKLPKLQRFLIDNIEFLGLRELLISLISDQYDCFVTDLDLLLQLICQKAKSPACYFVVSALRQVIRNKPGFAKTIGRFETIDNLIEAGLHAGRTISAFETFSLIESIIIKSKDQTLMDYISHKSKSIDLSSYNPSVYPSALMVLTTQSFSIIEKVLSKDTPSLMCSGIVKSINSFPKDELIQACYKSNFIEKLISSFPKSNSNCPNIFVLEISRSLDSLLNEKTNEWNEFFERVNLRLKINDDYLESKPAMINKLDSSTDDSLPVEIQTVQDNDDNDSLFSSSDDDNESDSDDSEEEEKNIHQEINSNLLCQKDLVPNQFCDDLSSLKKPANNELVEEERDSDE